jgi:hypothetical protein
MSSASSSTEVSAVVRVATISPRRMTETSSVTAMISRSLWVISRMVLPSALSCFEDPEQVIGLGRGQHAGRLVEDQDLGAAVERLQDLDTLLESDRQLLDDGIRIDLELIFLFELLEFASGLGDAAASRLSSAPSMTFSSTVKLSTSMKCW